MSLGKYFAFVSFHFYQNNWREGCCCCVSTNNVQLCQGKMWNTIHFKGKQPLWDVDWVSFSEIPFSSFQNQNLHFQHWFIHSQVTNVNLPWFQREIASKWRWYNMAEQVVWKPIKEGHFPASRWWTMATDAHTTEMISSSISPLYEDQLEEMNEVATTSTNVDTVSCTVIEQYTCWPHTKKVSFFEKKTEYTKKPIQKTSVQQFKLIAGWYESWSMQKSLFTSVQHCFPPKV